MSCLYHGADFVQQQNLTQLLTHAPWVAWGEKTGKNRNEKSHIKTGLSLIYYYHRRNRLDLGIMNLIYEKLEYFLSDSASGKKITNTKITPFFFSASSQLQPHSTPSFSTSSLWAVQGGGEWGAAASPHQLLSAIFSSSHFSLLHPGAFPGATGKHQCQRGVPALSWGSWS